MDVTFATVPSDNVTFFGIVTFFVFLTGSLKYTPRNGHRVFKISYFLDIDN